VRFRISTGIATSSSHYIVVVKRGEEMGVGEGFGHLHRVMPFLRRHADEVLRSASKHNFEGLRDMARSGKLRLPMGLEIALLDLLAKEEGLRACELMGKPVREEVRVFRTIPLGRREEMVRTAVRLASRGWGIKLKIGMGAEADLRLVRAVREAIGPDVPIVVDANQVYPPGVALRLLKRMERYDLWLIEQPCFRTDLAGLALLRRALDVPLMLDESIRRIEELRAAVERGAIDVLNLKVCRVGGLLRALDMLEACVEAGVGIYVGTGRELGIGASALLHLSALVPDGLFYGCEVGWWHFLGFNIIKERLAPDGGLIKVPEGPGLGVTLLEPERIYELVRERGGHVLKPERLRLLAFRGALHELAQRFVSLASSATKTYYLVGELRERVKEARRGR